MNIALRLFPALLALVALQACGVEPKTEDDKTFYAIGIAVSQSLEPFALTEKELEMVKAGISDGVQKKAPKVDMQAYLPKAQQMAQARASKVAEGEKKAGEDYVAKAAAEAGAKKTESGAIVIPVKEGSGAKPKATDRVTVHYEGTLVDGTVFDSSLMRGQPATFPLNGVIKCWTEGVQQIKVGGKAKLVCPADIAYGDRGSPPKIKPGATLVFQVELIEIAK